MNLESERKLKFDRRLHGRHGWLTDEELDAELESLPDSAGKALAPDEDPEPAARRNAGPAGSAPPSDAPPTGVPGL